MDDEVLSGSVQHSHHVNHHHNHPHHIRQRHLSSGEEGAEEEELDPRIQVELEKLNRATEEINRLELELDDARASFRQVLSDSSQRLNGLAKKLGTCVDKARPYYDARMKLKESHLESQKAALRFERACSMHEAAKEMVQLAEEGYKRREEDLDPTWQEMLNHATMKVNDAERERMESEDNHQSTTLNFKKREEEVQKLQRDLKRAITKSKPYFEMKAKFNQVMEDHKRNVSRLEEDVASTKALYSEALRNLEAISDDIHRQRLERRQKMQLGIRGSGVGAESPSPPPTWEKDVTIDGSAFPIFNSDGEDDLEVRAIKSKKRWKEQGIVGYDLPLCRQSSDQEDLDTSSLKSDPLNVVIFKTDSYQHHMHDPSHLGANSFPSHPNVKCARSLSYRQAVGHIHQGRPNETAGSEASVTNSPQGNDVHVRDTTSDSRLRLSSMSPKSLRRSEAEAMQSSLSRAQEWVNKSPIPQQRRFIKSKSLIDASSPPPALASSVPCGGKQTFSPQSPTPTPLSLGKQNSEPAVSSEPELSSALSTRLSSEQLPSCQLTQPQNQSHLEYPTADSPAVSGKGQGVAIQIQPHLQSVNASRSPAGTSAAIPGHCHVKSSPRSVSSTSDQSSPLSGSPSGKSPKLQGLILRVDAAGMLNPPSAVPSVNAPTSYGLTSGNSLNNPVVMSRKIPALGVVTHQQHLAASSTSSLSLPSTCGLTDSSQSTPMPLPSSSPSTAWPSSSHHFLNTPATSLHPSQTQKATSPSLGGFRLPSYSSKTAPPSAFHLPSPTRNRMGLSSIPAPALRQIVSPTPPSPSGDRVSVLSGRSDSSKGGLLRPPSDSSDTESIASTGPMLDDDQVEFLTLDFNEQSISSSTANHQIEDGVEFLGDNNNHLQRGNWSRMSLPPRLGYLGGFLERARQMTGTEGNGIDLGNNNNNDNENRGDDDGGDADDDLSPQVEDEAGAVVELGNDNEGVERDNKESGKSEDVNVNTDGNSLHGKAKEEGVDADAKAASHVSCREPLTGVENVGGDGSVSVNVCIKLDCDEDEEKESQDYECCEGEDNVPPVEESKTDNDCDTTATTIPLNDQKEDDEDIEIKSKDDEDIEIKSKDDEDIEIKSKDDEDIEIKSKDDEDIEIKSKDNEDLEIKNKLSEDEEHIPDNNTEC